MLNKIHITPKEMKDVLANPHGHDIKWPTNNTKEGKKLALSYSKIETFETCPRQYAERFIYQTVPFKTSPILEWGNKVHKALEDYIFKEQDITDPSIKPFESVANALIEKENNLHARGILQTPLFGEQNWACDLTMRAHSWYDNDGVFLRGKADVGMATRNTLFIYDWKSGQGKNPKPEQLELMGLLAMAQPNLVPPSVTKVDGMLVFLEARKSVDYRMMTADYQERWKVWVTKAFTILDAYQRDSFPEVQSGLCGKWCDCFDCPFNGRNADGTPK